MLIVSGRISVASSTTHKVESFAAKDLGDTPLGQLAADLSAGRQESEADSSVTDVILTSGSSREERALKVDSVGCVAAARPPAAYSI